MAEETKEPQVPASNTFIVQVLYQQNGTWQGTVKWVDSRKTEHFRSALELIRLIDDAVRPKDGGSPV